MNRVCASLWVFSIIICINASSMYDQSQTGKLNVQVDLKDLNLFAILKGKTKEEYVDYDYAYDYSEMTIKPHGHKSTTAKPINSTNSTNITSNMDNNTMLQQNATTELTELTTEPIKTNTTEKTELLMASDPTTTNISILSTLASSHNNETISSTTPVSLSTKPSNCKKGFIMNQKGDCELRLQGTTGNALLKLVKLSQKLKLRRENKRQ